MWIYIYDAGVKDAAQLARRDQYQLDGLALRQYQERLGAWNVKVCQYLPLWQNMAKYSFLNLQRAEALAKGWTPPDRPTQVSKYQPTNAVCQ